MNAKHLHQLAASPIEALHTLTASGRLVCQAHVVDLLLDCYAATTEPAVREEITVALVQLAHRTLLSTEELRGIVDLLVAATEVESAFSHLLLAS
ncbi:MAG: hypothetical protein IT196_12555 [Acidimicrobiales bacterium]|nr:hypothetical protein [Acidimicrobiales bacterium]